MKEIKFPPPKCDPLNEVLSGKPLLPLPLLPNPESISMLGTSLDGSRDYLYYDPHDQLIAGKIFWNDNIPKQSIKGLVLMCHGAPTSDRRYKGCWNTMGSTLAANGFVAASVRHKDPSVQVAAEEIVRATRHVMNRFQDQFALTGKPLALIGHSEGGTGALWAGKRIPKEVGEHFSSIRCIAAIAPPTATFPPDAVSNCCQALLVLQGTLDMDSPYGGQSLVAFQRTSVQQKYFGWLHGCNHARSTDSVAPMDSLDPKIFVTPDILDTKLFSSHEAQSLAVANFVSMFVLWHAAAGGKYRGLFTGQKVIKWDQPGVPALVLSDLQKKIRFYPRYEDAGNTMPLGPLPSSAKFTGLFNYDKSPVDPIAGPLYVPLRFQHPSFANQPEESNGAIIRWNKAQIASPSITVAISNPDIANKKAAAIEFDAILISENKVTPPPVKLRLIVKHSLGTSKPVDVLVEPSQWLESILIKDSSSLTRSMLSTVRVPIPLFEMIQAATTSMKEFQITFGGAPSSGLMAICAFRAMLT